MTAYISLMLVTIATAYIAIRVYRAISGTVPSSEVFSDSRVVMLSSGNGQWQLGRQQGFVRPDRRVSTSVVKTKASAKTRVVKSEKSGSTVRKPWGW